jgi:ubiquinol oxidase
VLDNLFDERPIERFWFLETIARLPYFSYISCLHLYESLGWWRASELRKIHNAQEWNELHHLLIMESLGGNAQWSDRFVAYHTAVAYYFFLVALFFGSPKAAYQFMELLELHAVDTYTAFVQENQAHLAELPPPEVARSYYSTGNMYMFDDFQMRAPGSRRPPCDSLLDVFQNICDDEGQHVDTMRACQNYAAVGTRLVSPHLDNGASGEAAVDAELKREHWNQWASGINEEKK